VNLSSPMVQALKALVHELVAGNFATLAADRRAGRLTAEELANAVANYGRTLIDLPDAAFETADVIPLAGQATAWAVDLDLWSVEEGQSDLTLSVTLQLTPDGVLTSIDDLHVL
jgi:hypothetical protein